MEVSERGEGGRSGCGRGAHWLDSAGLVHAGAEDEGAGAKLCEGREEEEEGGDHVVGIPHPRHVLHLKSRQARHGRAVGGRRGWEVGGQGGSVGGGGGRRG